jgi:hypothetical protein
MFCYEKYQKYHGRWYIERATYNARIEVIPFDGMDEKKHPDESNYYTPTWIFDYACK